MLLGSESVNQQLRLLGIMHCLRSSGDTGTRVPPYISDPFPSMTCRFVHDRLDPRLNVLPGSTIQRLFLTPNDGLGIGIPVQILLDLRPREWVELFQASNCSIPDAVVLPVFVESSVYLARTENDSLDILRRGDGVVGMLGIWNDVLELRVTCELLDL